jgi:hypothetical protein
MPQPVFDSFDSPPLGSVYDTIASRNEGNTTTKISILDVYPMTVLRKDGHISSAPICSSCRKEDWYVTLFYSIGAMLSFAL